MIFNAYKLIMVECSFLYSAVEKRVLESFFISIIAQLNIMLPGDANICTEM